MENEKIIQEIGQCQANIINMIFAFQNEEFEGKKSFSFDSFRAQISNQFNSCISNIRTEKPTDSVKNKE